MLTIETIKKCAEIMKRAEIPGPFLLMVHPSHVKKYGKQGLMKMLRKKGIAFVQAGT